MVTASTDEKKFTFRVPVKLYNKIKRSADRERRSMNQWMILHFEEFFQPPKRTEKRG